MKDSQLWATGPPTQAPMMPFGAAMRCTSVHDYIENKTTFQSEATLEISECNRSSEYYKYLKQYEACGKTELLNPRLCNI